VCTFVLEQNNRSQHILFILLYDQMKNKIKWSIDPSHSEIAFKVKHLMITNVKGTFTKFDANIYTSDKDFTTAEIELWIDTSSITTGFEKRDEHLKSIDFLNVKKHDRITFKSNTIGKPDANSNCELCGELVMNGISKYVKLNLQLGGIINNPRGIEKAGFAITGKIKRSDWNLSWNKTLETGGILVSDEILLSCEIELNNVIQKQSIEELEIAHSLHDMR